MTIDVVSVDGLVARWWVPIVRGVAAITFGVLLVVVPWAGLLALILMWGSYALINGGLTLLMAARRARAGRPWGWLVFEGLAGVAAGVASFAWPDMTALALLTLLAVWAVVTGVAEVSAAIRLRREIRDEWLLAATGILSIAFGVVLVVAPAIGIGTVLLMLAAYATLFGALLIGFGIRLHRWRPGGMTPHPMAA